ncbi:prevent-host-death family protein [Neisseria sp. HMSC055H02]|jgi:prevent-host-death family protein|nr:prevent-host-death family protein [Neisseria sp. HMSC055H02]
MEIQKMDYVISYTAAREDLAQVMTKVCEDQVVTHITRRNGGNCVLMSEEEYSSIMETLYLFGNPANAARLEHSLAQAEHGEFVEVDL